MVLMRFYLTYEELKHCKKQFWWCGCLAILSYLWGIETQDSCLRKTCWNVILSYLWGIETFHTWWTMERVNLILSYLWGIETHKQVLPACWPWKFYLTYEELKHKIIDSIPGGVGDFILPMRNWNVDIWVNPKEQVKDFILPMRNWNTFQSEQIEVEKLDFILPMRNWNFGCSW